MKAKLFLLVFLSMVALNVFSQQVSNIKVRQDGNLALIHYDLVDPGQQSSYFIDAFCSTDGGATFPIRLSSATGSIGSNIKAGNGKEISWDILKDINSLKSDETVFKIVAHPEIENSNIVVTDNDITFTITTAENLGGRAKIGFMLNVPKDDEVFIDLRYLKIYDYEGNIYSRSNGDIQLIYGDFKDTYHGNYETKMIPAGIPVKGYIIFKGIPEQLNKIALMVFRLKNNSDFQVKDIYLTSK
jgi:hypothetical protein